MAIFNSYVKLPEGNPRHVIISTRRPDWESLARTWREATRRRRRGTAWRSSVAWRRRSFRVGIERLPSGYWTVCYIGTWMKIACISTWFTKPSIWIIESTEHRSLKSLCVWINVEDPLAGHSSVRNTLNQDLYGRHSLEGSQRRSTLNQRGLIWRIWAIEDT